MSKYTGREQDKTYEGEAITVHYGVKRCIHAAECVKRLSDVFDTQRRPWINADGASVEAIADAVEHCPSGALHVTAKDGSYQEAVPTQNTIILWQDGPIQIHGDLTILGATVDVQDETRATLCRCGASNHKPFCDNTHKDIAFQTEDIDPIAGKTIIDETGGKLKITAHANGPLEVEGHFEIRDATGETLFAGSKTWLCRCGHSARKPFCDSTHKKIGFEGA